MIKNKNVMKNVEIKDSVVCDFCKKEYSYDVSFGKTEYEAIEFVHIKQHCGYGTIFKDGEIIEVDICQHCFKKYILDKIKKENHNGTKKEKARTKKETKGN